MNPITTLAELEAMVESNNNALAVRFEPLHVPQPHFVLTMKSLAFCSFDTAKILCSMSWGKYQIMGDVLVSLGLNISPLAYIHDNAMQDDFFHRFIAADHLQMDLVDILTNPTKRALFARLYNGPGNIAAYEARMISVAKTAGLQVML